MDFRKVFDNWIREPGTARREALFNLIQAQENYTEGCDAARLAIPLLRDHRYAAALNELTAWMPGMFLNPGLHRLLALAHEGLDNPEQAETERWLAELALNTITSSGDGSRSRPWWVLRIADQYDVVRSLRTRVSIQRVEWQGQQLLDGLVTDDGRELWFALYNNGRRRVAA